MVNSSGLLVVARKRPLRSASEYSPVLATWIACHGLLRAFSFSAYKTKRARMEGESTTQASTPAGAVFLSYASQDAEAAARTRDALRVAKWQCGSHAIPSVPQRSFQCPLCRKLRVLLEWPELAGSQ